MLEGHRRMVGTGGGPDRQALETAIRVVPDLVRELGLGEFLGALAMDTKPRLVLRFRLLPGSGLTELGDDVVLKVYGDQPRGEGPLLELWQRRGIPTPRVCSGERDGCSWLLLEYLELEPIAVRGRVDRLALTEELAAQGATMHRDAPELIPVLRRLDTVMLPRWEAAVDTLSAAGHTIDPDLRTVAAEAYRSGPSRPLHGDLGLPNVARTSDGRLVLYDASALVGPPVHDAACWAARLANDELLPEELLLAWAGVEPLAVDRTALELLTTECVLEAGTRVLVHGGSPSHAAPEGVRTLLGTWERLSG